MRDLLLSLSADRWLLPAMLLWPIFAAALVRVLGRDAARDEDGAEAPAGGPDARKLTFAALAVEGLLGLALWEIFDPQASGWQARVDLPWLPDIGATFSVGVDGLALVLVVMTVLVVPLALLGSWNNVKRQTPSFGAFVLLLTSGLVGVFVSLDLMLFYMAWELMLVPTYFLIGIWGRPGSEKASMRYVVFTLLGSLLMLVAIIALWQQGGGESFHLDDLRHVVVSYQMQLFLFTAFFIAFAVKSAMVPFHTWLPDAQTGAPTVISVTLSIKVGMYAMLRFAIPLFPEAAADPTVRSVIIVLAVVSIIYGAMLAMTQRDFKRLVSYSVISHVGFVMLGCFIYNDQTIRGAVMGMVASGVSTSALFLLAGILEDRRGTTDMSAFGGMAKVLPAFSVVLTLAMFSSIGLPGLPGFIGEFLVLVGTYKTHPVLAVISTTAVIIAAIYGLRALQAILYTSFNNSANEHVRDLNGRELSVMTLFAAAIVGIGLAPSVLLDRLDLMDRAESVVVAPSVAPAVAPAVDPGTATAGVVTGASGAAPQALLAMEAAE